MKLLVWSSSTVDAYKSTRVVVAGHRIALRGVETEDS